MKKLAKLAVIIILAVILQIAANEHALNERGYKATGGEVLVFPVTLYLGYKVFLSENEEEADKKEYREEEHSYGKHVNRRVS